MQRGERVFALNTEGGHVSFAPGDELEIEILRRLMARFGRVSNERLLCGSGLENLYRALCEIDGRALDLTTPEQITAAAHDGAPAAERALALFCELLGAAAGDLVLAFGAWQGVYLTGGLTPLLLPWLQRGGFRRRLEDKGRHSDAMRQVPTVAVSEPDAGLLGAAAAGIQAAGGSLIASPG
jgi:glucokinase